MRLGIVTSSYAISPNDSVNAGVFVRDLAHDLANLGHDVHVLSPRKYGEVQYSSVVHEYYFPWLGGAKDLASASLFNPVRLVQYASLVSSGLIKVTRYIQDNQLEALLAMWAIPSGLFCWRAKQRFAIPYGVWALGSDIWARKKYPFGDWVVKNILQNASFRFADGVALAKEAEQISGLNCEFVPSLRRLPFMNGKKDLVLKKDIPNLLFIGRYELNKGPDILVDAARLLLDRGCKFYLHMFGTGSLQNDLAKKIRGYESYISLNGYADPATVISYMKSCDWLVIPSRIESIPLIFSDSIQMHLPVIATDVGDMGKLTQQLGVGLVVSAAEKGALAAVIQDAISNKISPSINWESAAKVFDLHESAVRCQAELEKAITQK